MNDPYVFRGKTYRRLGSCRRCGKCCISCPKLVIGPPASCLIWDELDGPQNQEVYAAVGVNTTTCRSFPYPGDHVLNPGRHSDCGYSFEEVKDA